MTASGAGARLLGGFATSHDLEGMSRPRGVFRVVECPPLRSRDRLRAGIILEMLMPRLFWILAAFLGTSPALAQTTAEEHAPNATVVGVTVGVPGYQRQIAPELTVVGLDILYGKPSRPGLEFALGTIPRAISNGAVVLGGRLDASLPIAMNDEFWLIPVAGGTMIGGGGSGGAAAFGGINAGIGSILWTGHTGFRTSVTWHHFINAQGAIWLAEIGVVGGR